MITPDLIPDEADEWLAASDAYGLDRIFLVAPSSTDARLATHGGGLPGLRLRDQRDGRDRGPGRDLDRGADPGGAGPAGGGPLPVGVGLGVRDGDQAAEVGSYADGVIVGSALVRCLLDAPSSAAGLARLRRPHRRLAAGVRRSVRSPSGLHR